MTSALLVFLHDLHPIALLISLTWVNVLYEIYETCFLGSRPYYIAISLLIEFVQTSSKFDRPGQLCHGVRTTFAKAGSVHVFDIASLDEPLRAWN